jgi:hypothetical protein
MKVKAESKDLSAGLFATIRRVDVRRKTTVTMLSRSIDAFVWNDKVFYPSVSSFSTPHSE